MRNDAKVQPVPQRLPKNERLTPRAARIQDARRPLLGGARVATRLVFAIALALVGWGCGGKSQTTAGDTQQSTDQSALVDQTGAPDLSADSSAPDGELDLEQTPPPGDSEAGDRTDGSEPLDVDELDGTSDAGIDTTAGDDTTGGDTTGGDTTGGDATGELDASDPDAPMQVRVMTFNIRTGTAGDGDNNWLNRAPLVLQVIDESASDFLGMQEAWKFQLDAITNGLPRYNCIGRSRMANTTLDEWSPVCYDNRRFDVDPAENGTFWLSETPEVPGSQSWSSSLPRIVTWGRFVEKGTGRALYVFNTHFDHKSQDARLESAKLVAQRIFERQHTGEPFVLIGDLNAGELNEAILYLKGQTIGDQTSPLTMLDTFRALYPDATSVGTFHGFNGGTSGDKIDYIFIEAGSTTTVLEAAIIHFNVEGRYPSDHFPVTATIEIPNPAP